MTSQPSACRDALARLCPDARPASEYLDTTATARAPHGIMGGQALAMVAVLAEQPHSDVAVFVGTVIHGPDGIALIAPGDAFVTIDGGPIEPLG